MPREARIVATYEADQMPSAADLRLERRTALNGIGAFFQKMAGGLIIGTVSLSTDGGTGVAATGTVTFSGASGTTSQTINGVAFSQTTGTDAARATDFATALNATTTGLASYVSAVAVGGVVTLTSKEKGGRGNLNTLAVSGTGITASGTRLSGGTDDTNRVTVSV